MSEHTKGPWSIRKLFSGSKITSGNVEICWVDDALNDLTGETRKASKKEMDANARLIAAAPEMLEALESLIELCEEPPEAMCSCHISPPCSDCQEFSAEREARSIAREVIARATGKEAV